MNKYMVGLAGFVGFAVISVPAAANYAIDTGASQTNGLQLSKSQSLAGYFTLASALEVSSVEGFITGLDSDGTITIYSDAAVPAASNALFSADFAILSSPGAWQGVFDQKWKLDAGSYWVGFSNSGNGNYMYGFAPTPLYQYAFSTGSVWTLHPPLAAAPAFGVRIDGNRFVAAVPEPASWTMMIAGFGAIGGMLRNRRRKNEALLLAGAAGHGHAGGGLGV